jgi:hypothetical protein
MNAWEKYGRLQVQLEILQNQILECKREIAQEMRVKEEPKKEEPQKD